MSGKTLDSERTSNWAVLTINVHCAATTSLGTCQTKVDFSERQALGFEIALLWVDMTNYFHDIATASLGRLWILSEHQNGLF
jgi:hypothetical protein